MSAPTLAYAQFLKGETFCCEEASVLKSSHHHGLPKIEEVEER